MRRLVFAAVGVYFVITEAEAAIQRWVGDDGVELRVVFHRASVREVPRRCFVAQLGEPAAVMGPDSSAPAVERMLWLVAVPSADSLPDFQWEVQNIREWASVEIATVGGVLGSGNTQNRAGTLMPGVRMSFLGIWRGIPIALLELNPWEYTPEHKRLRLWEEVSLRIRYPAPIRRDEVVMSWALLEAPFAHLLLNPEHALAFRRVGNTRMGQEVPFPIDRPVLRLGTKRDGIAVVPLRDILQAMPEWRGRPSQHLQLLWSGHPVPLYLRDRNGVLDDTDTLLFFGRRAAGDTTWWDTQVPEEAFFLVLQDSGTPVRFIPVSEAEGTEPDVEILPTTFHWEQDKVYVSGANEGFFRNWTEAAPGEGWYWAHVRASEGGWSDSLLLPALDTVRVRITGFALNSIPSCAPEHRWWCLVNGDTLGMLSREGWGPLEWQGVIEPGQWSAGWNRWRVKAIAVDTAAVCGVAEQGIDAIEFVLRPQPFAVEGKWQGVVAAGSRRGQLVLHGFASPTIAAIDTLRGRIAFLRGEQEQALRVAARAGSSPWVEVFLGDHLIVHRREAGILLLWWQPPRFEIGQVWLPANASELRSVLQQIAPEAPVVWVSVEAPSPEVLALLRSWGLQQTDRAAEGWAWVWTLRRSDTSAKVERVAAPGQWANLLASLPIAGNSYQVALALAPGDTAHLWVEDEIRWERASLQRIEPSSLAQPKPQADVVVIAHPRLWSVAQRWATEREQKRGVRVRLISVQDIATVFGYGRLTPQAIKDFLRYAYARWQPPAPQAVVLFGSANWDARGILGFPKPNLVPAYGVPPSDYWYGLLEGEDWLPELFVGRIPAADTSEAVAVLEKIAAWEAAPPTALWRKHALLIFGYGFSNTSDTYYTWMTDVLGMQPYVVIKETPEPASSRYGPLIRQRLEEGVGLTIYFGHGAEANMEVQGWEPNRLTNAQRQGLLMTLSCSMGNFAVPYTRSFNEQYVVSSQRGMVAALGMSGIGVDIVERTVQHYLFQTLVERKVRMLGPLYVAARLPLMPFATNDIYRATILQHTLLGDPLLTFPVDTVPELLFVSPTPLVHRGDRVPRAEFVEGDLVRVRVVVGNAGVVPQGLWRMRILHDGEGGPDTLWLLGDPVRVSSSWDTLLPPRWRGVGFHRLTLQLNPDSAIEEQAWDNNEVRLSYLVRSRGLLPLEPLPFWHVQAGRPRFRVLNPLGAADSFRYEAELWRGDERIAVSADSEWRFFEEAVDWQPAGAILRPGESYRLRIRAVRIGDALWTQWLEVPFWADTTPIRRWVQWQQKDSVEFAADGLRDMEVVRAEDGAFVVRIRQWQRSVELVSDPVRSRAVIQIDGQPLLEAEQEAGIGAAIVSVGEEPPRTFFYRTGRTGQVEEVRYFLSLVRDSVRVGQYLIWVLSGDGLWRFTSEQLDTLRSLLRRFYNASQVDSLVRSGIAFAFVAQRGGEKVLENFRRGDSLRVQAKLVHSMPQGRLLTPWIGPSRRLGKFILELRAPRQWVVTVYGRRSLEESGWDVVWDSRGDTVIDLSGEQYAYAQLQLEALYGTEGGEPPELRHILYTFEPQGEMALRRVSVSRMPVMSGDTLTVNVSVVNRSLRAGLHGVGLRVGVRSEVMEEEQGMWALPSPLGPEGDTLLALPLSTSTWAIQGMLWARGRAAGELYSFNNAAEMPYQLTVDTLPPTLQLWWHEGGRLVPLRSGMTISRQPELWLLLSDASSGPVRVPVLRLWIEGRLMDSTTAVQYRVYPSTELDALPAVLRQPGVRSALFCQPSRLPLGRVIVWATGEDAAGLRDTLQLELTVTDGLALRLLRQYPNPTSGGMSLEFAYDGYTIQELARVEIFSSLGQRLYAEEFPVTVGQNRWDWRGHTREGVPVSPGVYFWRLWLPRLSPTVGGIAGTVTIVP